MVAAASGSWPGFRECINLAAIFVFLFDCATSLTIQPSPINVGENQNASFNCQLDPGEPTVISVTLNGVPIRSSMHSARFFVPTGVTGNVTYTFGPVTRSDGGLVFECSNGVKQDFNVSTTLVVLFPPSYTLPNELTLSPAVLEGTSSYTYQFTLDANPVPSQFTWTKDGQTLSSDDRVALTVNSVTIRSEVRRGDSGTYVVSSMNGGGQASANFTLDVQYLPEFTIPTVRSVQLNSSSQFTFNCTASAANPSSVDYSFHVNGSSQPFSISGPVLTISAVVRADTGNYSCTANNTVGSTTLYYNLLAVAPPQYSLRAGRSTTPLEGSDFTYQFNLDNGGVEPTSFTWSRAGTGGDLMNGAKYTLTADSITVKNVSRDDSAMYTVRATNMAGSHSNSFTLDVQYPPSLMKVENSSKSIISGRDELTIDCTPTPGNPSSTNVTFRIDSIEVDRSDSSVSISSNSNVLTISPVERRHRGAYTCTASNGVGQDPSVTVQVDVFGPPTAPRSVAVSGETSFSATVMWTAPEDSGLSSPFSSPSEALNYHISYNSSSTTQSLVNDTLEVVLSNLQHSTNYTVRVEASNVHGTSPASNEVHFRTSDSKPILQAVDLAPLSLNNFTATVTFLTVGGQDVTNFSITINDSSPAVVDSTPVPDGKGVMVSLIIEGQSFTKGTYYSVEITATNSVGTSEPITGLMFVPNPPMITGAFTDVSAGSIPSTKCCAGVQLMLAEQPDVSNLKVLLTPQGGNQFTVMVNPADLSLEGFTLYIGGVQAGTNYTAVVTVSNIFGSSDDQHLQLEPLLGVPSNPNPPTVSMNGGQVTVELSTAYPGTVQTRSGSMFRFEIQFIEDGQRSSRQSKTEMLPVTPASLFNTSAIFTTNLDPGSYSVSVTAVNEHGQSSAVMSESTFSVEVTPAPEDNVTIIIIIVIVVVVVPVLIVLIIAIICIICCMRVKKNKKEKYHVGSEDTELTTNRNAVEKNSLDGDRDSFMETGIYDEVGKETKKPPKPQSTPASTTNGQPQPGGDVYAEVNKPKKTNKEAATPTTPPTGDVYAAVDMLKKTKKPKTEAPADKVDPEATLYAEVVQEKKEPAVPPKTEAEYQNPEVDKPIEENELQYAALDFSKAPSSFKKPAPPNPDENVIYSEVTIAKKH